MMAYAEAHPALQDQGAPHHDLRRRGRPVWWIPLWAASSSTAPSRRIWALWTAPTRRTSFKFEVDFLWARSSSARSSTSASKSTAPRSRRNAGRHQGQGYKYSTLVAITVAVPTPSSPAEAGDSGRGRQEDREGYRRSSTAASSPTRSATSGCHLAGTTERGSEPSDGQPEPTTSATPSI